jgi:hypothetical protein
MMNHAAYFQLKPEPEKNTIEELVRKSRGLLLKTPEVLSVKSVRNLAPIPPSPFFFSIEMGSLNKFKTTVDDPHYNKLMSKNISNRAQAIISRWIMN